MKKVLLYHGLPLVIALTIVYLSGSVIKNKFLPVKGHSAEIFTFPKYFDNYKNSAKVEDTICHTLWTGSSIVVMGSSEMTLKQFPAIPYNFFKCFGLGHEGNQCLAIFSQLCAMSMHVNNAKIVIILSPGWFCSTYANGTSLQSFLEFNSERFLYNAYFSTSLPDSFKTYLGGYIAGKLTDIESPSAIIKAFYFYHLSHKNLINKILNSPILFTYNEYCCYKASQSEVLCKQDRYDGSLTSYITEVKDNYSIIKLPKMQKANWDSLYDVAAKEFILKSNNNTMGVDSAYYNKWIKKHQLAHLDIIPIEKNKEFTDFKMLVKFLKYYKVNTYFIIQPLNPLAYDNLQELNSLLAEVKTELGSNNFSYYDMYTTDSTHYRKGILNDVMHLGNLGWYMADSAIYAHFYK